MDKFTPGPWEARTFLVRGGTKLSDTICHVGTSTNLPPSRSNESEANAKLIAAAPEMLAALKALTDFLESELEGDASHPFHAEIERAKAAITKATT